MKGVQPVYVWQVPVRVYHWLNMACILTLFFTGLYIGSPDLRPAEVHGEATTLFRMGDIVFWHLLAGYVFAANLLFRLYWYFAGNEYARSPHKPWEKAFWSGLWSTLLHYLFIKREEPHYLGHNPVAYLAYFVVIFLGSLFMIFTGFAMFSEARPDGLLGTLFGWVIRALGGSFPTHMLHHTAAWIIIIFAVIHLYLVIRHDIFSRSGVISSMFNGFKYETRK